MNEFIYRNISPYFLDRRQQIFLNYESAGLTVLKDVAYLTADKPKIDRDGDQTRFGHSSVYFHPLNAIVGQDAQTIAFPESES
jgi:hypothetical protein